MIVHSPPAQYEHTPLKVALVSGLSDPTSCALTPSQLRLVDSLHASPASKLRMNFPYLRRYNIGDRTPSLLRASWNNTRQFLGASRQAYRLSARDHWQSLIRSTDRLLVITISCGLEIMNQCVEPEDARRLHILALGPIAWSAPKAPHTLVQGERDYLSRLFFRRVHVTLPGRGHMDYLEDEQVEQLANEHVCSSISRS